MYVILIGPLLGGILGSIFGSMLLDEKPRKILTRKMAFKKNEEL